MNDGNAPGWGAIDGALQRIYDKPTQWHLATRHPWALGGRDPLDGISFYPRTDPVPHWHVVGYGMSELYEKESENPEVSGWGFEFTFRLARTPGEEEPPQWPAVLLQSLGRYVFDSGNVFAPGHTMPVGGALGGDDGGSRITAITFTEDPEMGTVATPNGRVSFLQVVGLTRDEYEAAKGGRSAELMRALAPWMPLGVTDVGRGSLLDRLPEAP